MNAAVATATDDDATHDRVRLAAPGDVEVAGAAFWVALLSTVSRYESTWRPEAVGGGGQLRKFSSIE